MSAVELIPHKLYYYADFSGPATLEYLDSPDNSPTRYVFWNVGRGQARTLDEMEILKGLYDNLEDCKTACRDELLRLADKLNAPL